MANERRAVLPTADELSADEFLVDPVGWRQPLLQACCLFAAMVRGEEPDVKPVKKTFSAADGANIIGEVRGKGLMIGFDVPETLKDLRKNLLFNQHIFTGEAKPNVIRLLPALNLTKAHADRFLETFTTILNQ